MDGFIQMMNSITLDFGYMTVEYRRDRGVQSVLLPEDSFGWHYSQTYLGKDYVGKIRKMVLATFSILID